MTRVRCSTPLARRCASTAATAALVGALALPASMTAAATAVDRGRHLTTTTHVAPADVHAAALEAAGVFDAEMILVQPAPLADRMAVELELQGIPLLIDLARVSNRSDAYQIYADRGAGRLEAVPAGPVKTFRGAVTEWPGSRVSGGYVGDGLHLSIVDETGARFLLQPVLDVAGAPAGAHLLYSADDVRPHGKHCGVPSVMLDPVLPDGGGIVSNPFGTGDLCGTQLGIDCDFEYFQDYGTIEAVEDRVNLIINTVNEQYETQVNITHFISAFIIRTDSNDPYTSSQAQTLLCQFITEWSENQITMPRDVAHLFTGREINGGTIGIAADIGDTGICQNNGGCEGGTFGTFGSYCLSQSDFNGDFGCATDLTAHELGHLWGAFHCSCTSNTMNPFITCANDFSGGSIESIGEFRDSLPCLSCSPGPPGACCLPGGTCGFVEESLCEQLGGTFVAPGVGCASNPCDALQGACCLPTGLCFETDDVTCASAGGVFAGFGTTCMETDCSAEPPCAGDFDDDGAVTFNDVVSLLAAWGPCPGCPQDLDEDDSVGFSDLVSLLALFGPCP